MEITAEDKEQILTNTAGIISLNSPDKPTASDELTILEIPKNAYYEFYSDTGQTLPLEVLDLLPEDPNAYYNGQTVTAIKPETLSVKVIGGEWTFKGYDTDTQIIEGTDIKFTGIWTYIMDIPVKTGDDDNLIYVYVSLAIAAAIGAFIIALIMRRRRKESVR